ncbi:MAG TPA: hypothetical protein VIL46_13135 [Gemmataceae bacterium]
MIELLALGTEELVPIAMFLLMMAGAWYLMTAISQRNTQAEERLERLGRSKSLADIEIFAGGDPEERSRFAGLREVFSNLGGAMQPKTELE